MKKAILFSLGLLVALSACEEDNLVVDNPAPSGDNVTMAFIPFYGDSTLKTDSIYNNRFADQFVIDSVRLMLSNVFFISEAGDTFDKENDFIVYSTNEEDNRKPVAYLEGGGYNGRFYSVNGLDTAAYYEAIASAEINETIGGFRRIQDTAYNHFEVYGRLFDPTTTDTAPTLPVVYQIGTTIMVDTSVTGVLAFSVNDTRTVNLVLLCDLKPAFDNIDMFVNQQVVTDPSDFTDLSLAQALRDSLKLFIF